MHKHILQKFSNKNFWGNYSHHKVRRGHGELCNAVVPNTHELTALEKFETTRLKVYIHYKGGLWFVVPDNYNYGFFHSHLSCANPYGCG